MLTMHEKAIAIIATLALAGFAGYLHAGTRGALFGVILAAAAVCWKYA